MRRLTFSLPLSSIIPIGIGVSMLWGFLTIFNAIRFTQCTSWVLMQSPPEKVVALLGTLLNRPYIETENKSVYCLKQVQWSKCSLPPYKLQPDFAPSWLINKFQFTFQNSDVAQIIRSDGFPEVTYYSLRTDGRVFSCSTNRNAEIESIFRSGLFVWLLIPTIAMIWSVASFFNIFIKYGQPTIWDFWGRGERIK